jgi:hypothetical protein
MEVCVEIILAVLGALFVAAAVIDIKARRRGKRIRVDGDGTTPTDTCRRFPRQTWVAVAAWRADRAPDGREASRASGLRLR